MLDECNRVEKMAPSGRSVGGGGLQRPVRGGGALCRVPATAASLLASLPSVLAAGYQLPPPGSQHSLPAAAACNPEGVGEAPKSRVGAKHFPGIGCRACFTVSLEDSGVEKSSSLAASGAVSLGRARLHCPPAAAAPGCCRSGETAARERDAGSLQKICHFLLII